MEGWESILLSISCVKIAQVACYVVSSLSLEVYKSRVGTHLEERLDRELKHWMGTLLETVQPKDSESIFK